MRTAKEALQANVEFWTNRCGYKEFEVAVQVKNWTQLGFDPKEVEEAKQEYLLGHQLTAPQSV